MQSVRFRGSQAGKHHIQRAADQKICSIEPDPIKSHVLQSIISSGAPGVLLESETIQLLWSLAPLPLASAFTHRGVSQRMFGSTSSARGRREQAGPVVLHQAQLEYLFQARISADTCFVTWLAIVQILFFDTLIYFLVLNFVERDAPIFRLH